MTYKLDFLQLKNFLEKARGKQNIKEVPHEFHVTRSALSDTLHRLYPFILGREVKAKFTKIIKIIENEYWTEDIPSDQDFTDDASEDSSTASSMDL